MKQLVAIDGNSLLHRAYYALPSMTASDGTPTGALHGFLSMLLKLVSEDPDYLAVAFDMHGPTFRHLQYAEYKAGRKETPEDLRKQFPLLQELLRQMGIAVLESPGYEADDILGTLSKICEQSSVSALLVTGDRDALQLASEQTHILMTKKGISDTVEFTPALLMETYGLTPEHMRDLKGLMGDSSDNIPGVPGVGEKTALKLLSEYGTIEGVLAHGDEIKGKLGERVRDHAQSARMSYSIGTIFRDVPIGVGLDQLAFSKDSLQKASPMLLRLELRSIIARIPQSQSAPIQENTSTADLRIIPIEDEASLFSAMNACKKASLFALDAEDGLSFCVSEDTLYAITQGDDLFASVMSEETVWSCLSGILEDPDTEKILFDSKRVRHLLKRFGHTLDGPVFDTMIGDYLINAVHPAGSFSALVKRRFSQAKHTAAHLLGLRGQMMSQLKTQAMESLYHDVEYPLSNVLFEMEREGFLVDDVILKELQGEFQRRIERLSSEIYELAGEEFNIMSPKQLGQILFEKLRLPSGKKTKTGYSTDADTLEKLAQSTPIVSKVLEYRFVSKLKSTFVDGLLAKRDTADGRVHSTFNQCVTATGRISSTEPNLQNIPVRTPQGREIRKAFIASKEHLLIGADYSQIELRLLAHISGDPRLIEAFLSGDDIHRKTAAEILGLPPEQVSQEQRSAAKAVNFGIVYGISDYGLAQNLNIPVKQAGDYIQRYLNRYPQVREYMTQSVVSGRERGYAETLFHRRRSLPEISSGNYNTRSFGERVAMNMPIQGSAADIIKLAMVRVAQELKERGFRAKLILQIHDELIVDAAKDEAEAVAQLVKDCMESVAELKVPLIAEVKIGKSWYDTK